MKNKFLFLSLLIALSYFGASTNMCAQQDEKIRLIVRGDDIGSTHAANIGHIKAYKDGILTAAEIMVPCPWFEEAVKMLNENPGIDVGIHCALTSEWENYKWRPITHAPSITDEDGYFYPMIWPNDNFPAEKTLRGSDWKLEEIEKEIRAQVELALKKIPHISHMNCHMGCSHWDDDVKEMFEGLVKEYGLDIYSSDYDVKRFRVDGYHEAKTTEERIELFAKALKSLEPGTYLYVEHPAVDSPEMRAIALEGNYSVAKNRDDVVKVLTSDEVKNAVKEKNIELIGYKDLPKIKN
jgi:chitin disaccharide deacetylase